MSNEALLDILDGFVGERDGVDCELTNWKLGDYECELYRLPKGTVCAAIKVLGGCSEASLLSGLLGFAKEDISPWSEISLAEFVDAIACADSSRSDGEHIMYFPFIPAPAKAA